MKKINVLEKDVLKYNDPQRKAFNFVKVLFIADNGMYGLMDLLTGERFNYPMDDYLKRGYVEVSKRQEAADALAELNAYPSDFEALYDLDKSLFERFGQNCKIEERSDSYDIYIEDVDPQNIEFLMDLGKFAVKGVNEILSIHFAKNTLEITYAKVGSYDTQVESEMKTEEV